LSSEPSDVEAVIGRVRRRAIAVGALAAAAAFALGWRSGLSLTITAAVVIFSFLVLEKLTRRLVPRQVKPGLRDLMPLLTVTAASFVLLALVLWRWKEFDSVAGAVGLSVVFLAIIPEIWMKE
jgi:hypothetical protein